MHRPESFKSSIWDNTSPYQCIMKIRPRLRIQSQVASQKLNTLISDTVATLLVLLNMEESILKVKIREPDRKLLEN